MQPWLMHTVENYSRASWGDCELDGATMEAMDLEAPPGPMAIGDDAALYVTVVVPGIMSGVNDY